jgi:hypothetical protein
MQVAHQHDHITHAVIGGGETIDFGISNSAEFFNILSSTLYKDQILAVVREVLCNGWDAHIEAGITDRPVEITLTETLFSIRDYGTGIHHNEMGLIYGTYGNSTKKNDGKQTGGFGLGCKAPFAYTDHFEVISHNNGVKTIYNLSKSSAAAMGKPGIIPIATFPTQETGLQVSIHIHNLTDYRRFKELVAQIVRNGDMNMTLNGQPMKRLGFDTAVSNYLIIDSNVMVSNSRIMIRYGNVLYPVDRVGGLEKPYDAIVNHLHKLRQRHTQYNIIFQALPHSISVTPSRESLSMQEHTINSLKALFTGFLAMIDSSTGEFHLHCDTFAHDTIKAAAKAKKVSELLSRERKLPSAQQGADIPAIQDLSVMAQRYMQINYPVDAAFRQREVTWRLQAMVQEGLLDRGLVQSFLNGLDISWLQRRILAPLLVKMQQADVNIRQLYVYDPEDRNAPDNQGRTGAAPLVPAMNAAPQSIFHALPYLRNIVVLSTSSKQIKERASTRAEFNNLGGYPGFLFYQVGGKKVEKEKVQAFFKASGMVVVDLTIKTQSEVYESERRTSSRSAPAKPKQKGVVSLLSVLSSKSNSLYTPGAKYDDAPRIEVPEFVVQLSIRDGVPTEQLGFLGQAASRYIVDLFGAKGGVTFNSAVHASWIEKGAKEMLTYVAEKVAQYMLSCLRIKKYWPYDVQRVVDGYTSYMPKEWLLRIVYGNATCRKKLHLVNNLTEEDKKYVHLWHQIVGYRSRYPDTLGAAYAQLKPIPLHPINQEILARIQSSPLFDTFQQNKLTVLMGSTNPAASRDIDAVVQLLVTALKP